jgi:hypothetical protein
MNSGDIVEFELPEYKNTASGNNSGKRLTTYQ